MSTIILKNTKENAIKRRCYFEPLTHNFFAQVNFLGRPGY